jgi:hypothetical protein
MLDIKIETHALGAHICLHSTLSFATIKHHTIPRGSSHPLSWVRQESSGKTAVAKSQDEYIMKLR